MILFPVLDDLTTLCWSQSLWLYPVAFVVVCEGVQLGIEVGRTLNFLLCHYSPLLCPVPRCTGDQHSHSRGSPSVHGHDAGCDYPYCEEHTLLSTKASNLGCLHPTHP